MNTVSTHACACVPAGRSSPLSATTCSAPCWSPAPASPTAAPAQPSRSSSPRVFIPPRCRGRMTKDSQKLHFRKKNGGAARARGCAMPVSRRPREVSPRRHEPPHPRRTGAQGFASFCRRLPRCAAVVVCSRHSAWFARSHCCCCHPRAVIAQARQRSARGRRSPRCSGSTGKRRS